MTTPDERLHSLVYARDFLYSLLDAKKTPRVPRSIRREAAARLRHYPEGWAIQQIPTSRAKVYFARSE